MRPRTCGIYQQMERAIDVLSQHHPESPVIAWWKREGMFLNFRVRHDSLSIPDQDAVYRHMTYLKKALEDALQSRDVDDIEYLITRLVSDIEEINALIADGRP